MLGPAEVRPVRLYGVGGPGGRRVSPVVGYDACFVWIGVRVWEKADRQTDRQRQTETERDREREREGDRERDRERDRETER